MNDNINQDTRDRALRTEVLLMGVSADVAEIKASLKKMEARADYHKGVLASFSAVCGLIGGVIASIGDKLHSLITGA